MARDRQRAKQRQAERRAKRIADQGGDGAPAPSPAVDPELAAGAPPEEEGRADQVLRDEPEVDELDEDVDPELVHDAEEAGALEDGRGLRRRGGAGGRRHSPRAAAGATPTRHPPDRGSRPCSTVPVGGGAELRRVQWPDRQALTTLTGSCSGSF